MEILKSHLMVCAYMHHFDWQKRDSNNWNEYCDLKLNTLDRLQSRAGYIIYVYLYSDFPALVDLFTNFHLYGLYA